MLTSSALGRTSWMLPEPCAHATASLASAAAPGRCLSPGSTSGTLCAHARVDSERNYWDTHLVHSPSPSKSRRTVSRFTLSDVLLPQPLHHPGGYCRHRNGTQHANNESRTRLSTGSSQSCRQGCQAHCGHVSRAPLLGFVVLSSPPASSQLTLTHLLTSTPDTTPKTQYLRSEDANPPISFRPRGSTTSAGFSVCGARRYCTPMPDEVHRVSVGAPLCLPASDSEESFHTNQGRPRFYRHSSARPFPRRMTPRRVSSSTAAPRHRGRCPLAIFRPQTQRAVTVASVSPKLPEEPPEGCPPLHPCSSLARFDSPSLAALRASGCLTTGRCVAPGLCSVDEFVSPHARCRTRDV